MITSKNPVPVSVFRKGSARLYTDPCSKAGAGVLIMRKVWNRIEYKPGQRIGNCIYLKEADSIISPSGNKMRIALFQCACGKEFESKINPVKSYRTVSCGCYHKAQSSERLKTHGLSGHPLYSKWIDMKDRCYNPKAPYYKNYGGRGITVCDEWLNDAKAFIDYVSSLPNAIGQGLTIDRIRNNEGYKPGNLRWATYHIQSVNQNIRSDNKSGYIGVSFCKERKKYTSTIGVNRKKINLGRHNTDVEALHARNKYIIENNLTEYELQSTISTGLCSLREE